MSDQFIKTPDEALEKALNRKCRQPQLEHLILQSPFSSYQYALWVVHGPWPEAEYIISKCPTVSYYYARNILNAEFKIAEPAIANSNSCFSYIFLIKKRFKLAEPKLDSDELNYCLRSIIGFNHE